jgi:FkbM family methyltransferase
VLRRIAAIATDALRHGGAGPGSLERRLFRRALATDAVAVLAGGDTDAWARAVREARPAARILVPDHPTLVSLDAHCRQAGIRHIGLLRMSGGEAASVLRGAATLLGHSRIDIIAFDGAPRPEAIFLLSGQGYERASPLHASPLLHQRLRPLPKGANGLLDIAALCRAHAIQPCGVIHVGAHEGQELAAYRDMRLRDILFIEANPRVFARLQANVGAGEGVILANCAITDRIGPVALRVTSGDQSSSILKLHRHREHYPGIVEEDIVEVPGTTLDALLDELGLAPAAYNLLNMDIQGAEAIALRGAEATLRHIAGINIEVNFEELYAGCAEIEELDDFLGARGFRRVATACPFHRSWGDAFYVRAAAAP